MNVKYKEALIATLKEYHIAITQNRLSIYKLLTAISAALSVSLILKQSTFQLDRIFCFRGW